MRTTLRRRVRNALTAVSAALLVSCAIPCGPRGQTAATREARAATATESRDWTAEVERTLAEREYEATDAGLGLQAPNRAHGLRIYFERDGVRVADRHDDSAGLARLRTVSVGGEAVGEGEVVADGARVEVRRPGVVEWYENTELGLEQGWTIARRPAGGGPLAIEVATGADAVRVEGGRAALEASGRRLQYGGLAAWDASGEALMARLEPGEGDHVRLVIDDGAAEYPVTVDPTLTSPAFATLESNRANSNLGMSVAGAGDVNNDGYADCIVGAYTYDTGQPGEGAAFVFVGGPNGIGSGNPTTAAAVLRTNLTNSSLGYSVAGAGDVNGDGYDDVVAGAINYTSGQDFEGAAFVYLGGPGGIPSGTPATVIQSNQAFARLGWSVAGAGDVNGDGYDDIVAGVPYYDSGQADEGAAFVYLGGPGGIPSGSPATAATAIQSNQANANLGISVAGAGDVNNDGYDDLIVGSPSYNAGQDFEGVAPVFLGGPGGIPSGSPATASALLEPNVPLSNLGWSVAGAGDVNNDGYDDVIVGAVQYDSGETNEGAAFVFLGGPGGIPSGVPTMILQSNQTDCRFGESVAGAGDVNGDGYDDCLVGASDYDAGQPNEGAAFVFLGGPTGIASGDPSSAAVLLQPDQAGAALGTGVAGMGDVNGDGYDDCAFGAPEYDAGQLNEGVAFVYLGGPAGLAGHPTPKAVLQANQTEADLGVSVAGAGDVNNDGYDDVIVGADLYDAGQVNEGAAFVFLGGPSGIASANPTTAATFLQSNQTDAGFGIGVAGAGDVNGDGYDDILVGAYLYDSGQEDEGAVFVFLGGPGGVPSGNPSTAATVIQSNFENFALGSAVAGAGDVNNDGYDDVILGLPNYSVPELFEGAAFVYKGGPGGIPSGSLVNSATVLQADQTFAVFGLSVAGAGDTNGDGYDDVIVGAYQYSNGQGGEGAAFVFAGGPSGIPSGGPATAATLLDADQDGAGLGWSVAGAGDTNGDGYDDVIVGAPGYDAGQTDEGAAFVFSGGPIGVPSGNPQSATAVIQGDQIGGQMGTSVAGAGDVDGDGYDDVVVSGLYGDPAIGTAFVYLGSITGVAGGPPRAAAATLNTHGSIVGPIAGAGDTNGDGFDDVIVGAPIYTNGQSDEGAAFVYQLMRAQASGGADTVGIYVAATGAWFLRNANSPGGADTIFTYGGGGSGVVAIRGDWDGDGDDTPGLYVPSTGAFFLRNANSPGSADVVFTFGAGGAGYVPMVGDWNGDGTDTIGLYAPSTSTFFLRNTNAPGPADVTVGFGPVGAGWTPMAGDWDGDGDDTVGLYAPTSSTFFLRNANAPGAADVTFGYGPAGAGWKPVAGDFDGDGDDTVGLYRSTDGVFFLRNTNAPGAADLTFGYGPANVMPLVGDWNGL